jgi:hypothetical protein
MNKSISVLSTIAAMVLFTGCTSSTDPKPTTAKEAEFAKMADALNSAPSWVSEPIVENGIGAVGVARYSKGGISFMMPQAEMDGKARLAARIQEEVSRLQQQSKRVVQTKELDTFDNNFKEATEVLVKKIPLSGAKRIKTYMSKETGDLYVLMAIQKRDVADSLDSQKDLFKTQMEEARMTREAIEEGMQIHDKTMAELRDAIL